MTSNNRIIYILFFLKSNPTRYWKGRGMSGAKKGWHRESCNGTALYLDCGVVLVVQVTYDKWHRTKYRHQVSTY